MKKIAYVASDYIEKRIFINALRKYFVVHQFRSYETIKNPDEYDIVFTESEIVVPSQRKFKNLMTLSRGVEVYTNKYRKVNWDNVTWLWTLQPHQEAYFRRRNFESRPQHFGVLPVPAPLNEFTLRKEPEVNNKVALIANITDRKGTADIPDFLLKYPDLHIYHLGQVCLYGDPVREYVRWRLERDGTTDRYHWQKHIPQGRLDAWLEDKTYIWLPSISEGFSRAILEGMCKGLKPIVKEFAGAREIWMPESLYDTTDQIQTILDTPYEPEKYRKFVEERYHIDIIMDKFLKAIEYDLRFRS